MNTQLTISLHDLAFFSYHGWHEEEKKTGNNFVVNCHIVHSVPSQTLTSISQTVNYVAAYEIIKEEMQNPRELLETLAMEIVEKLHKEFPGILRVEFDIRKTSPPIAGFQGSVGIRYSKDFNLK